MNVCSVLLHSCLPFFVYVWLQIHYGSVIVPGASRSPYYCELLVCVLNFARGWAVWRFYKQTNVHNNLAGIWELECPVSCSVWQCMAVCGNVWQWVLQCMLQIDSRACAVVRGSVPQKDTQGAGEGADIHIQNSNFPKVEYRWIFVESKTKVFREQ